MDAEPYPIAVVDDEQSVARAIGHLLRSAGYAVRVFHIGKAPCASLPHLYARWRGLPCQ